MFTEFRATVELARDAHRFGLHVTAEFYMRQAIGHANRVGTPSMRSRCFRIVNKLRPMAAAQYGAVAADIMKGNGNV